MFEIAEYIGIIAFASSGFFVAVRNQLDFLGTLISVFLTALGGGIIRDVVVDKMPFTFTHNVPALTILIVMILLIVFRFNKRDSIENKPFFILSDSIGLISFSITGALIAIEAGLNLTGVLALAFVTAVGGGIIRDVIINEIPFVLKTGFYGTIALLIGLTLYILNLYELISYYSMIMVFIAGIVLRLVAYYKKWAIPMI
ncbi:TRIC cation channel family protein [Sulfurovum sp. XGS-02]|uniref:trimeric intracellular cation channel family protein n=1 Tax=Sulfurovum sp. XGS-02 TaxID=2925411 RepID=UPI002066F8CA|nr:TRIC cation channel family protein [Sulfurovum sp. XGS-02]UPT78271.1 TRIC cation channel family protein [Sulfurovum sp. XGS-02]